MTPQIIRLNEAALYSLGMDRVTVQALRNMVRVTGNESDGPTVPDLAGTIDDNDKILQKVKQQVILIQLSTDYLESAPAPYVSLDQKVENVQVELRQLAEQVAMLTRAFELDMRPMTDQFMQFSNQVITEVRQLADQQMININQIQEIKQGTML